MDIRDELGIMIEEIKADNVPCYWDKEIAKAISARIRGEK